MTTDVHPPSDSPVPGDELSEDRNLAAQSSPEFAGLRRSFRAFVLPTTIAFLVWYLLYVVLSVYARGFMDTKVVGHINIAFVFGLLQFISTFAIAWAYSRYARRNLDPVSERIRAELEGHTAADADLAAKATPVADAPAPTSTETPEAGTDEEATK
jgi:uncharacterized membrane protein (DUF485 family)